MLLSTTVRTTLVRSLCLLEACMRMVASPMREHKLREGWVPPAAARRATTVSSAEVAEEICIISQYHRVSVSFKKLGARTAEAPGYLLLY
eukprot:COSAG03_NODE_6544_length_1043_cov_1.230932_2_plen_90_part_00